MSYPNGTKLTVKLSISMKFGVYLISILGVMNNFTHKMKSNFCQTCRVNYFKKQGENRYIARSYISGVPFGGKNRYSRGQQIYEA